MQHVPSLWKEAVVVPVLKAGRLKVLTSGLHLSRDESL